MRAMLKICLQSPKHKCKYILLDISLMLYPLKFKMFSKRALVQFQLSFTFSLALLAHLQCSSIILPWLKNSWTLVHELLYYLSMSLDICFAFPTGILNRVSFPFDQIFKVCLPSRSSFQLSDQLSFPSMAFQLQEIV
jgi:hypothetical protein